MFEKGDSFILDSSDKFLGGEITVKITSTTNTSEKNEFKGIVTGIRANKIHDNPDNITILAKSPDILLNDGEHCKSFEDKTLEKIVKEVVKEYKLDTKFIAPQNSTDSLPYTVQYKESAYAFINRLAAKKGEWFFYNMEQTLFLVSCRQKKLNYNMVKTYCILIFQ
ncbi:MAG: contractile injection system protein, VgrG/Pvc8 family [Bacteroidales bacterium]